MGEKIRQKKKTLWMRYVNFEKIKDILHLVNKNNGKLRAGELEHLAIEQQIFVKEDSKPFSHSARYHYRKVMENLDLWTLQGRAYFVSQKTMAQSLLKKTAFKKLMSFEAQEIIRKVIIENKDCRRYFFDIFMGDSSYNCNIEDLRKRGKWIIVETKGKEGVVLNNPHTHQRFFLNDSDKIHAIFWGIRLWALDLWITDEIFISYKEGRFIYPISTFKSSKTIINLIIEKVKKDNKDSEWVMLHIPSFIKEVVLSTRLPVEEVKKVLWKLTTENPSMIMLIPSSTSFIDIRTPFAKQDSILLKPYIIDNQGRYISHIKIHKDVVVDILRGGAE